MLIIIEKKENLSLPLLTSIKSILFYSSTLLTLFMQMICKQIVYLMQFSLVAKIKSSSFIILLIYFNYYRYHLYLLSCSLILIFLIIIHRFGPNIIS